MSHFYQKVFVFTSWLLINLILITTSIVYSSYWYIFLVPLSVSTSFNCFSVLLILAFSIKNLIFKQKKKDDAELVKKSFAYLIPCYNETEEEINNTIKSLKKQTGVEDNKKVMLIVCDGRVKGSSELTTDEILKVIFKDQIKKTLYFKNAYKTWLGEYNNIEVLYGYSDNMPFICFIKDNNVGKRDGLVLIRSILHNYNNRLSNETLTLSEEFESFINNYLDILSFEKIDYIVGTDADTVFEESCSYNLLQSIEQDDNTHGVVGFVHVSPDVPKWSIWSIYQFTEYIIAQCLRRVQQSIVTNKVSCLSGCVQILRVSEETCGNKILSEFNKLPKEDDNVWRHILSFASEDRNHVCLMLHMYPYVKTRQCITANAYTIVPTNIKVFRSQRRRWSLGATSNDIILSYKSGINLYERIGAIFNVLTYSLSLFIFVATILFYYSIFVHPNMLMLYLSSVIFVPILYEICIIFWFPFKNSSDILRFCLGLIFYILFGSVINIFISIYSLLNVDCFKWGKTRILDKVEVEK